ncbi:MAG: hypothetical protein ACJARG_001895, partial [Arcticibacterium sp.]
RFRPRRVYANAGIDQWLVCRKEQQAKKQVKIVLLGSRGHKKCTL